MVKSKRKNITAASHHSKFVEAVKHFKLVKDKELGHGLIQLTIGLILMNRKAKRN